MSRNDTELPPSYFKRMFTPTIPLFHVFRIKKKDAHHQYFGRVHVSPSLPLLYFKRVYIICISMYENVFTSVPLSLCLLYPPLCMFSVCIRECVCLPPSREISINSCSDTMYCLVQRQRHYVTGGGEERGRRIRILGQAPKMSPALLEHIFRQRFLDY